MVNFSSHVDVIEPDNSVRTLQMDSEGTYFDAVQYIYESGDSFRRKNDERFYETLDDMNQPIT